MINILYGINIKHGWTVISLILLLLTFTLSTFTLTTKPNLQNSSHEIYTITDGIKRLYILYCSSPNCVIECINEVIGFHSTIRGICRPYELFSVFDDIWVKGSVIDLWADILNKQQKVLKVLCLSTELGYLLNNLFGNVRKRYDKPWLAKKFTKIAAKWVHSEDKTGILRNAIHKWIEQTPSTAPKINMIIIPFSYQQTHWVFIHIDLEKKIIYLTDSLRGATWDKMNWHEQSALIISYMICLELAQDNYMKQFFNPMPQVCKFT